MDTDALDLDSLDIKWGQRSTFELKDINLRLEVCLLSFTYDNMLRKPFGLETGGYPSITSVL